MAQGSGRLDRNRRNLIEIATDKVDSEVPSSPEGVLVEKLFDVDAVVKVGEAFAIIESSVEDSQPAALAKKKKCRYSTNSSFAEKLEEEIAQVKESVKN